MTVLIVLVFATVAGIYVDDVILGLRRNPITGRPAKTLEEVCAEPFPTAAYGNVVAILVATVLTFLLH